ncbi:MAG TPA: hypothetical protein VGC85_10345 [Chthoniobacterales bacterium]
MPRLIQWWRGRDAVRSEKNGIEANLVGVFMNVVAYAFGFEVCLTNHPFRQQLLWAVPLVCLVWIFWLNIVYLNSLAIRVLRGRVLPRDLPQSRAQSILIGIVITLFALRLLQATGWLAFVGAIWIGAVIANLAAAAILFVSRRGVR